MMSKKNHTHLLAVRMTVMLFVLHCFLVTVSAQDDKTVMFNPVEHAVVSQTIAPDARGAGMGDVGVATDPDVNSQYWNPAKYPFCISRSGIALNYTPWLRRLVNDIDLAYLAGYYRIGDYSAVSGSLRYFSLGEVFADDGMSVKPYEMSLDVAYSLMLSEKFSLAAAIRWIHSDLRYDYSEDSKPASAFAADLAMYYNNYLMMGSRECQLGIGLNLSNIGSKISFYGDDESQFLPANMRLGASLMIPIDEYNRFSIAADANKLLVPTVPKQKEGESNSDYQDRVRSVGAEYVYHDQFSLRAGYHHQAESKGNLKYFTVGGGFRMSVFSLDVGYVISTARSNPLDQTLRFTLAFDMDGIKDLFKR